MKPRPCVAHCESCHRHFAGDKAFDKHRIGAFEGAFGSDSESTRHCLDPSAFTDSDGNPWFEEVEGVCRVAGAEPVEPVTVWRQAGASERGRRFREEGEQDGD